MWSHDSTLDIYRNEQNPSFYVEVERNKVFPGWSTFYLAYEPEDLGWKMIATDKNAALEEALLLMEKLEVSRPWENEMEETCN